MLRLGFAPYLTAPVTIDMPFSEAARSEIEPTIAPLEIQDRNFFRSDERSEEIPINELDWLKDSWHVSAELAQENPQLLTAVLAWDSCRVRTRTSHSVLTIWGALEQIFSPSPSELRHRVAANIAAYLEPRGPQRLATYKHVMKLYDARSSAAHTAKESDVKVMIESWVILRNALVKMISEHHIPSQSDFEHLHFADVSPVAADAVSWSGRPNTNVR